MAILEASSKPDTFPNRLGVCLFAARWVLAICALVFSALYIAGRLDAFDAALAFGLVGAAIVAGQWNARLVRSERPPVARTRNWPGESIQKFAEALSDPCFIIDRRGIVRYRNSVAAHDFPSTTFGEPLTFSLRNPVLVSTIDRAVETGRRATGEFSETVPSGNWYQITAAPLDDRQAKPEAGGRLPGMLLVKISSQNQQRKHDLVRADFVANASHELRTPLTSLIGYLDTLRGAAADDEIARARFIDIMHAQAARMSQLIDDLLSLSRIELRQHIQPVETIDLSSIVREVIELLQPQASAADVTINFKSGVSDAETRGDRNELVQVMANLIENAIKYAWNGRKVDVVIGTPPDHMGHKLRIDVRDYGPGIAAKHVPRLTERFYRVEADSPRREKGTGLGLAIVKHIMSRHRGDLSIVSDVGKGTTVSIFL